MVFFGHGVLSRDPNSDLEFLHQDAQSFLAVLDFLQDCGFALISMADLIGLAADNFRCSRPWVHLTFDDGYQNNLEVLLPLLARRQIPCTVFVSTHHIQTGELFYTDRVRCALRYTRKTGRIPGTDYHLTAADSAQHRNSMAARINRNLVKQANLTALRGLMEHIDSLLSEQEWRQCLAAHAALRPLSTTELGQLARSPWISLGSHNHHHLVFSGSSDAQEIEQEMLLSRDWLRANAGATSLTYAYPNGTAENYSATTGQICRATGYRLAFTTMGRTVGLGTNPFEIPRYGFPPSVSAARRQITSALFPDRLERKLRQGFRVLRRRSRDPEECACEG